MSASRDNIIRAEAGYIWDTCHILLSKQYSGKLDEHTKELISSMGKSAENLMSVLGYDYD